MMKKLCGLTLLLLSTVLITNPIPAQNLTWTTAASAWAESFGSQRAVIEISQPASHVDVDLIWRRHDPHPEERRFLVIEASTGDTIKNINRQEVNNEHCHIQFGPVQNPGTYYLYYLPFNIVEGWGYFGNGYLKQEPAANSEWLSRIRPTDLVKARAERIECRTAFDTFYPMEIIPTEFEKSEFLKLYPEPVLYFAEGRENPIRMKDALPLKWIQSGPSEKIMVSALQNEYYAFQVGIYSSRQNIQELKVETGQMTFTGKSGGPKIQLTCFNTMGIDPYGRSFTKKLDIPEGRVQALWFGADVPLDANPGKYAGSISISGKNITEKNIPVTLEVSGQAIADRGDSEPWRHSRLRWLNSTAGSDGKPVPPYQPVRQTSGNGFQIAGHEVSLAKTGLPETILSQVTGLLAAPIALTVETPDGNRKFPVSVISKNLEAGKYSQVSQAVSDDLEIRYEVSLEYDGYIKTLATVRNISDREPVSVLDIRLDIPVDAKKAKYMMGMGLPGCAVPQSHESKWEGPSDSFWIGNAVAGIWCELRGSSYHGPMLNLYHPAPPVSWNNEGKGGFRIIRNNDRVTARVYSGGRIINPGDSVQFDWAMLITPVKELNPASQFTDRYYHHGGKPAPGKEDFDAGVKIVNVHHANEYNPFINYPFIAVREMRSFIDSIHALGKKVKIYYTVRELTNHVTEAWALRSLGYEILDNGSGGGYPWLREHFVEGYTPQWYQHFPDGRVDASVLSAPGDSRWLNYYIEGLAWLVKNVDIDGLYLDDVTYDRRILQRMRSVMTRVKPGCIIDLHSNTGFSIGPANQYTEFFPYVDKLWFGESFQYDKMSPENWLVEVSGIPFGLMGDMLQGGGNRWLGMIFGMTVRYPWTTEGIKCDPRPVWKIWDEFGIQESKMTGFWDEECPVTTDNGNVKATVYAKPGKILISLGNFSDTARTARILINWKAIGLNPDHCRMFSPEIENFQPARLFGIGEAIPVDARKGWLIYLEEHNGL